MNGEQFIENQFVWHKMKEYYDARIKTEEANRDKCLEKKNAAAAAVENINFLSGKCAESVSLMGIAIEKTENVTENTVEKHRGNIDNFKSELNGYQEQLGGLGSGYCDRMKKLEEMYQKMAQNHIDNINVYTERSITCDQCENDAKNANVYSRENAGEVVEYGLAVGFLTGTIKDEMNEVTWVE